MIEHVLPLCLGISWVYSACMLVQSIVYEKERKLKEVMRTMGLTSGVHWLGWFVTAFGQMSLTMTVLTAVLKWGQVLPYSNPVLIWVMLELFAASTICFAFLISTFYSRAKQAAACAGIIYLLSYIPFLYISIREESAHVTIPAWGKSLASLSSTAAFGLGAKYFAYYEMEGVGCHWHNLKQSPLEGDQFNLFYVLVAFVVDIVIYSTLIWVWDCPWYFPFVSYRGRVSIWRPANVRFRAVLAFLFGANFVIEGDDSGGYGNEGLEFVNLHSDNGTPSEPEPVGLTVGVRMQNLTKIYKGTSIKAPTYDEKWAATKFGARKKALDGLNLNLYEGQVTALLGHNGAGKTTTISILTGLFPQTYGKAFIYSKDTCTHMDSIRQSLGTCPQHNVLFDSLTVEEHLKFYARLKSAGSYTISNSQLDTLIWDLGLPHKRHCRALYRVRDCPRADSLSGGLMRKLSVAIAFVGDSKTVILDEPTAGVDPFARRSIWDLILKYKKDRTILLSTHHMDEAELIADRIAILAGGQLRCLGSPLFLKATYGQGYTVAFVKGKARKRDLIGAALNDSGISSEDAYTRQRPTSSSSLTDLPSTHSAQGYLQRLEVPQNPQCDPLHIDTYLRKVGPAPRLLVDTPHEVHFALRKWTGAQLAELFKRLEDGDEMALDKLGVDSYGLHDTTLEQIFLQLAQVHQQQASHQDQCGRPQPAVSAATATRLCASGEGAKRSDSLLRASAHNLQAKVNRSVVFGALCV